MERIEVENGTVTSDYVVQEIVEAIAELEGADPLELSPPLRDSIDPDSLEALLSSADDSLEVTFTYAGYRISVSSGGTVSIVSMADAAGEPTPEQEPC